MKTLFISFCFVAFTTLTSHSQTNPEPEMKSKHLLIVGSSGAVGGAVAKHFADSESYEISSLTRSAEPPEGVRYAIKADLLEPESLEDSMDELSSVTHLFYAALKPNDDPLVEAEENETMLRTALDALKKAGAPLEHVIFVQGGKVYGAHLGIYKTPAKEDDSRHFPPNLYFNHEELVKERSEEDGFRYTAIRPDIIIGDSMGSAMNLGNLIGVYGTLCKELDVAMQFPGTPEAYEVLVNVTSAEVLAESVEWAFEEEKTGAFNITNGDVFRWKHVWPEICDFFGLEEGEPQPISLQERLGSQSDVWNQLVDKNGLEKHEVLDYSQGSFGDFIFHVETDAIFDTTKARQAGFSGMDRRSGEAIIEHLKAMQEQNLIPANGN